MFGAEFSKTFIFPSYFNAQRVQDKAEEEITAYSSKGKEEMPKQVRHDSSGLSTLPKKELSYTHEGWNPGEGRGSRDLTFIRFDRQFQPDHLADFLGFRPGAIN